MLVLDDEFVKASDLTEQEIKLEVMIAAYKADKIGWNKAAHMLGMPLVDFWKELGKRNIDVIKYDKTYVDELNEIEGLKNGSNK